MSENKRTNFEIFTDTIILSSVITGLLYVIGRIGSDKFLNILSIPNSLAPQYATDYYIYSGFSIFIPIFFSIFLFLSGFNVGSPIESISKTKTERWFKLAKICMLSILIMLLFSFIKYYAPSFIKENTKLYKIETLVFKSESKLQGNFSDYFLYGRNPPYLILIDKPYLDSSKTFFINENDIAEISISAQKQKNK